MTATTTAAPTAISPAVGAAPAGLTPAQTRVCERLQAARAAMAQLPPLDPAYLADEARYERLARLNGEDQ